MKFDTLKLPMRLDLIEELRKNREKELQNFFDSKCKELCAFGEVSFPLYPDFGATEPMTAQEVEDMLIAFRKQGYYVRQKTYHELSYYIVSVKEDS